MNEALDQVQDFGGLGQKMRDFPPMEYECYSIDEEQISRIYLGYLKQRSDVIKSSLQTCSFPKTY